MFAFRHKKCLQSFDNLFFSEFVKLKPKQWLRNLGFRVLLYLKKFKKYWMPLLFWVGVVVAGCTPFFVQPLGGRKVTRLCIIYDFGLLSFLNFVTRLIMYVFPKKSWIPVRLSCFQNQNMVVFNFNSGRLDTKYFWKFFLKFFMKRYRVSLNNNCVWRVFVFNLIQDLFDFDNSHVLKFLTAFRLPLFPQQLDF